MRLHRSTYAPAPAFPAQQHIITLSADSERTSVHLNAIRMQRTSSASADNMYVKYDDDVHTCTLLDCLHAWHMHGSMDVGHGAQSRLVDLFRHAQ